MAYEFGKPQPDCYNQPWRYNDSYWSRTWVCLSCGTMLNISELITPHVPEYKELCPDCVPVGSEAHATAERMTKRNGRQFGY